MKMRTIVLSAGICLISGLVNAAAVPRKENNIERRNNWSVTSSTIWPSPTSGHGKYGGDDKHEYPGHDKNKGKVDDKKSEGKTGKGGKNCDDKVDKENGKGKDGKGGDKDKGKDKGQDKGKDDGQGGSTIKLPTELPSPGTAILLPGGGSKPGDTTVPPNQHGDIDGTAVDENDPEVVLVRRYIERLARQTEPIRIPLRNDEPDQIYDEQVSRAKRASAVVKGITNAKTRSFSFQDAVTVLDDYYCTDDIGSFNCIAYYNNCSPYYGCDDDGHDRAGARRSILETEHNGIVGNLAKRVSLVQGTNAVSLPQIYRWRRGSVISLVVERNNKLVPVDLNHGITSAPPFIVQVRSSSIVAAALSKAYRYWNNADIGVQFEWSMNLGRSTFVTKTGGTKGTALATADYPYQSPGYQHLITAWDIFLEIEWQAVGPNILTHELGHALGLAHNDDNDDVYEVSDIKGSSIMDSTVSSSANVITQVPNRDRRGAFRLYNLFNPPLADDRETTVAILPAPKGPVFKAPNPRKCRWTFFGGCLYY